MKQNYLRAETLVSANARLVDFQSTLELAGHWGGGEVASADGMRFVTPVKTLNAGPNKIFWFRAWHHLVQLHFRSVHRVPRYCHSRHITRLHFVLEGLLEQQTGLNPVEIMTDTAGASDIILACSGCWDISFLPAG